MLDSAEDWLSDFLHDNEARSVTWTQDGISRSLLAIPADTPVGVEQTQAPQTRVDFKERWYQVRLSDFTAAGWTEPKIGARVTETLAGTSRTFEVMTVPNEPAWKWIDEARTAFQVRTKPVN